MAAPTEYLIPGSDFLNESGSMIEIDYLDPGGDFINEAATADDLIIMWQWL